MKRLRIAFVADTLHAKVGGGVISGNNVVERLRRDHDVRVVGADGDGWGKLRALALPSRTMRQMQFTMARPDRARLLRAFGDCDVVHLQFPFWLGFQALSVARRLGLPVVGAFHVQPENALLNVGVRSGWLAERVYRYWVKNLYERVDAVVCPTRFAEQKLRQHGLTAPTYVVTNGVPPDVVPGPAVRDPAHAGKFVVLMVGRLAAEKRQEDLIRAIARSRHKERIQLVIAGAGPREKELRELGRSLPNPAEVGFVPRARLLDLLRSADLFVHCSEVELEGISCIEAMSVGLPVLVADAPQSAAAGFAMDERFQFPAGQPERLAEKLDALIEAPALLQAARTSYRQIARSLDFESSVARLGELYREVVERRGTAMWTGRPEGLAGAGVEPS